MEKSNRTQLNAKAGEQKKMAVQKPTEQAKGSNAPLESARQGSISVAVFNGQFGKTVVVQKSYKKGDEWVRSQINLFMNELPNLQATVNEICEKCAKDIEASQKKKA